MCLKILKKNTLLVLLLFILSCLLLPCFALAMEQNPTPKTFVQIPTEQWAKLQSNNEKLSEKLTLLEANLILLDKPTSELAEQLVTAKSNLEKSNQALATAENSLANAEQSLQRTEESLTLLEKQIEKEREDARKNIAREKRKATVNIVLGIALGYFLAR